MTSTINIAGRKVGPGHPPFIIAEMSGNHNQSLDRAIKIVEAAAKTGCQALKIQTYTADTMTIDIHDGKFLIEDKESLWKGNSLYNLYKQAYTPWEWHKPIFDKANELGMIAFSTPFDETAVDFLEKLNVPLYKIASFENNHLPLLKRVARTKKPIIMSTGLASFEELDEAVRTIRAEGNDQIILLKCTSAYPARPEDANIATIQDLASKFGVLSGLSDHTMGIGIAVASVALGACVVEKHFTLDRSEGGVDSAFSMEPAEMKALVDECLIAQKGIGRISYERSESEKKSLIYRRSIFVVEDIKEGEEFTGANLRIIRPSDGLAPKHLDAVLGKKAKKEIKKGTPLAWDLIG